MDADGIPLAFDMYPGNQNEQTTLKPLETKGHPGFWLHPVHLLFRCRVGQPGNRRFNSLNGRQYVIAHSLKKDETGRPWK